MGDSLPRALPHEVSVDVNKINALMKDLKEKNIGFHSIMIVRNGKVIAEGWKKPYKSEYTHSLFSLSKSFTSTAIGFAVQDGLLSVDDKVCSFFKEELPFEPCEKMKTMQIKHLLSMTTGHSVQPTASLDLDSTNWAECFLRSYVDLENGSRFVYNTPGSYMLSVILQKVTGKTTFDYLNEKLFKPLSIENIWWEKSPQEVSSGGFGLNIKTEDIAKFGVFLINGGVYNGERLLNEAWINTATSAVVENYGTTDWGAGYGYQFWQCARKDTYRGDGAFGQLCVVFKDLDIVVALTSGLMDIQEALGIICRHISECVTDKPCEDTDGVKQLNELINTLSMDLPTGEASSPIESCLNGSSWELSDNSLGFSQIKLDFEKEKAIELTLQGETHKLKLDYMSFADNVLLIDDTKSSTHFGRTLYKQASSAYAWENGHLKIYNYFTNASSCLLLDISLKGDSLVLESELKFELTGKKGKIFGIKI